MTEQEKNRKAEDLTTEENKKELEKPAEEAVKEQAPDEDLQKTRRLEKEQTEKKPRTQKPDGRTHYYTKTRISTIPMYARPEQEKKKKPKKKRKIFDFKREKKQKNKYDRDEVVKGGIKTVSLLVIALIVGSFLAFIFLRGVIDIFALGKSEHLIEVTLLENYGIEDIAEVLHEEGVIRYPTLFKLWAILKKDTDRNFEAGTYIVSPSMNYDDLIDIFVPSEYARTEITVKIPEGSSVDDVIDIFLSHGIGTREGFAEVINEYAFDTEKYWFLNEIPEDAPGRIWRLEGFLYPDTYFYYSDASELTAITKLLDRFRSMFKRDYMNNCQEQGMSLMQALSLASVITEETLNDVDYMPLSSVFNNRLQNEEFGYLQVDSPLAYFIRNREGAYRELTDADRELACAYNTYVNRGIPSYPICSPTISTINAALYPEESDYYYFHLNITEYCSFAATKEEYDAIVAADLLARQEAEGGGQEMPEEDEQA